MKKRVIRRDKPTIFQQIALPLVFTCLTIIIILQIGDFSFQRQLIARELRKQFADSLAVVAAYFEATYVFPVRHDLRFIEDSYVFRHFLSSQKNEVLIARPLVEQLFLHFTNREEGIYLSLRFIDQAGVTKIETEGKRRKRERVLFADAPKDALHNGIFNLFSTLISKTPGTILCGDPFEYQGKWTFLIGIAKGEPETGDVAGVVILHCDLTEYFAYLKGYKFFGERVATVMSLNYEPIFQPFNKDVAACFGKDPTKKGKCRNFYDLAKEIRINPNGQGLFNVVFSASSEIFQRETRDILIRSGLFLFFAVILMNVIIWIISKNFSMPLNALIQAVQQFAGGNLSARAHVKTTGEIQLLSETFNGMAEALDKTTVSRDSLAKEIVERKQAEENLERFSQQNELILNSVTEGILGLNLEGNHTFINLAAEKMLGYKAEELLGRPSHSLWHHTKPDGSPNPKEACAIYAAYRDGTAHCSSDEVFWRKDGASFPVEYTSTPIYDKGRLAGAVVFFTDITERKKAEKALRKAHEELERRVVDRTVELAESRAYIEKILTTITDYIYTVTVRDGVAVATTHQPTCLSVTGYTAEEFRDDPHLWEKMVHEEDCLRVHAFFATVLAGKNAPYIEHRIRHKGGETRWVRNVPVLHYDAAGHLTSYDGIISDITEKMRAEMLLAESMEKEARANKAKDQFLANMSHEIRTPLHTMLGFTELLKNTSLEPVQKEYVEMLHDGEEILLSLVTDVLDFSKMAAGEVHLEKISFDLECLIRSVIKIHHARLQEKGLRIFCIVDEKVPSGFRGDPTRIRQVLMNLLSNAIKFTEKGEIEIRATLDKEREKKLSEQEAMVRIAVRDTGIGISWDKQKIIFDAFEQADVSTTRKYGGTGLGLAISRGLVTLMGGTIQVESEPGKGSTFSLVLPLEVGPAMAKVPIFPLTDKELEGKKILLLDDDKMSREILIRYCEKAEMVVSCSASSAQEAFEWLSEQSSLPDIFIVDILMPDMNGYEVAEKVRKNKKYENIKLVAVTVDARVGSASNARQSGFDAYLPKPVSRENFIKVIKTVLGDQREKILPVEIVTQHTAEEVASKGLKILVVDDNPASQELLSIILKNFEFNVETASDGREAVEKVKKDPYDLILMDLQMPVLGGVEATRIIREQLHKAVPILALTAGISENDRENCLAAGMNDYLLKPIEIPKLKDKVFHWIRGVPQERFVTRQEKSVIKWDKQRAVKELGVPEELYRELVLGFIEQSTTVIQNLEKAFKERNFEEVAKAAHFIKGTAGNLRIEEIYATVKEMEAVAKGDQDAGMIEKQMRSLKNAMEELKKNI